MGEFQEGLSTSSENLEWRSRHPLLKAADSGQGFICFHTQNLKPDDVQQAIAQERSIEIDVNQVGPSFGKYPKERVVMAHNPRYYLARGKHIPTDEELESPVGIVDKIANRNVFVKFDVKSPEVIDWVTEQAKKIKPHLRMVHAFVGELHAINVKGETRDAYIQEEGHMVPEYVPLGELKRLKAELDGIPIQASCRGISIGDINTKSGDSYPIIDKLCGTIKDVAEVINFCVFYPPSIPEGKRKLPHEIIRYVWEKYGLMVELDIDAGETAPKGIPFLGRSDSMQNASRVDLVDYSMPQVETRAI